MVIFGELATQLNALNISALSFLFTVLILVCGYPKLKKYNSAYSVKTRQLFLWAVAISPWFVATIGFFVALKLYSHSESGWFFHFHHSLTFHFYSWHSVPLLIFLTVLLYVSSKLLFKIAKHYFSINALSLFVTSKDINEIDTDAVHAFTSGFLNPKIYITKGLINILETNEITAVIQHEIAHKKHLDPLQKLIFSFFIGFFPLSFRNNSEVDFSLNQEQLADEYSAHQLGDETTVATALLKITKALKADSRPIEKYKFNGYCAFTGEEIRCRIHHLLSSNHRHKSFPYWATIFISLLFTLIILMSVGAFHHLTELFLNH